MDEPASMKNDWAVGALKPKKAPSHSPQELSKLAKDIATNLVFTDRHIRECDLNCLSMIFMPIIFGAFSNDSEEFRQDIGMIYEYYSAAGPTGINGYPIFYSMGFLNKEDAKTVWEKVEKISAILEEV